MQIEEIRQKLQSEIEKTASLIIEYEELTQPISPDASIGRLTRLDAMQSKSVAEAALRQSRDKLSKLKHALSNIGNANFGMCAKCGQQIPIGRILLRPESPYCVRCAQ